MANARFVVSPSPDMCRLSPCTSIELHPPRAARVRGAGRSWETAAPSRSGLGRCGEGRGGGGTLP
eukprot:3611229-Prymnesium_polylepis.2